MKLRRMRIQNFRSIIDADIEVHDYTMIVGANNAGKSNIVSALRAFYENIKHTGDDTPKMKDAKDGESWVELAFDLTEVATPCWDTVVVCGHVVQDPVQRLGGRLHYSLHQK